MKLTPEILQIQKRADKTLSFGCMIFDGTLGFYIGMDDRGYHKITFDNEIGDGAGYIPDDEILGEPMNRGRLLYIQAMTRKPTKETMEAYYNMYQYGRGACPIVFQQTVLERSPEFQKLVIAFLESLPDNTTTEGA